MRNHSYLRKAAFCCMLMLLGACATKPAPSTVIHTLHDTSDVGVPFANVLVISVAGDYESRELLERQIVAGIADRTSKASAYYTVIGRRPLFTRTAMETAISARNFDAVLFIRQKGQEREDLAPGRPIASALDLFNYDYPELNGASSIEQAAAITFVTELYSVVARKKIWSIDSLSFDKISATDLINEQAVVIAKEVVKSRLLQ